MTRFSTNRFSALCAVALISTAFTGSAHADIITVTLTGPNTASFIVNTQDVSKAPAFDSEFDNVSGIFDGKAGIASEIIFGTALTASDLDIVGSPIGGADVLAGPVLFTGSTADPIFSDGTFNLTQLFAKGSTVTIEVPEPAGWTLMLGLGAIGVLFAGLKRRAFAR